MTIPAAAGAVFGGATSVLGATQQNKSLDSSARSATQAERVQLQQFSNVSAVERAARLRDAKQIEGRIRARAGERGAGITGGDVATLNQNAIDTARNNAIAGANLTASARHTQTRTDAILTSLQSQVQSPILAGINGALGGAAAGLSLGESLLPGKKDEVV